MPTKIQNAQPKRRPVKARPPRLAYKKKFDRRKVKKLILALTLSSNLVITLRRFKTSKNRRSKRTKQLVLPWRLFSFKEIAIAKIKRPKKDWQETILWLPRQVAIPLMVLIPIANIAVSYNFVTKLSNQAEAVSVYSKIPPTQSARHQEALPKILPKSDPVSLKIPAIDVDSELIPLGRYSDGEIEMPSSPNIPGWYKYGPTPGELGPAVIVGHLDTKTSVAIFWRLHELKSGDKIEVSRADGSIATFAVTENKQLPRDNFPTQEVYGNLSYSGIRLITCGGTFDSNTLKYPNNTVIYGKLL